MTNLVELPKMKEETWKLVQHYLINFEKHIRFSDPMEIQAPKLFINKKLLIS